MNDHLPGPPAGAMKSIPSLHSAIPLLAALAIASCGDDATTARANTTPSDQFPAAAMFEYF